MPGVVYASLDDLKDYLGVTTAEDDALLQGFLEQASAVVRTLTGREFRAQDGTRLYDDPARFEGRTLYLDGDLAQVIQVVNGDGQDVTSKVRTVPRDHPPYWALTLREGGWVYVTSPVQVTGKWGYTLEPPEDVKHATIRLAAWMYRQKDTQGDVDRPLLTADGVVVMPAAIPRDVQEILAAYRVIGGY